MKKQAGVTLIEIVIALGIMSAVVAGTAALIDRSAEDTRGAVAAQHLRTIGDAANVYIKDNYTAVMANATPTTPALIRVSDLIAGGYLQAGFSMTNTYNQNACVLVLEPTANNLTALVITEGGTALDDLTLGGLAGITGAAGGGVYTSATTTVRGAMGGWSLPIGNYANANHLGQKCDGTAGVATLAVGHPAMALWFANGDSTAGFLYRDAVPGRPELNQMNTPIIMSSVQTAGTACTAGAIARDVSGALLSCDVGTLQWKVAGGSQYWQDPVANFASLPVCNAAALNHTRVAQTPTVGAGPRAYTCNGASWLALAVDNSGNLTVPGALTVTGTATAGNVSTTGTVTMGYGQVNNQVTENTACASNGLVARDSTGLILSCQSGVWKHQNGFDQQTTSGLSWSGNLIGYQTVAFWVPYPKCYKTWGIPWVAGQTGAVFAELIWTSAGYNPCGATVYINNPGPNPRNGINAWFSVVSIGDH